MKEFSHLFIRADEMTLLAGSSQIADMIKNKITYYIRSANSYIYKGNIHKNIKILHEWAGQHATNWYSFSIDSLGYYMGVETDTGQVECIMTIYFLSSDDAVLFRTSQPLEIPE